MQLPVLARAFEVADDEGAEILRCPFAGRPAADDELLLRPDLDLEPGARTLPRLVWRATMLGDDPLEALYPGELEQTSAKELQLRAGIDAVDRTKDGRYGETAVEPMVAAAAVGSASGGAGVVDSGRGGPLRVLHGVACHRHRRGGAGRTCRRSVTAALVACCVALGRHLERG